MPHSEDDGNYPTEDPVNKEAIGSPNPDIQGQTDLLSKSNFTSDTNKNKSHYGKAKDTCYKRAIWCGRNIIQWIHKVWNLLNSHEGAIVALLTIIITLTTTCQWKAMRRQNELLQDQIIQENRAWVGVKEIRNNSSISPINESTTCTVIIKNFGTTPAFNVKAIVTIVEGPLREKIKNAPPKVHADPDQYSLSTIFPDNISSCSPVLIEKDKFHWELIKAEKMGIFIYIRITYDDIFGFGRHTTHLAFYDIKTNKIVDCDNGNEAD